MYNYKSMIINFLKMKCIIRLLSTFILIGMLLLFWRISYESLWYKPTKVYYTKDNDIENSVNNMNELNSSELYDKRKDNPTNILCNKLSIVNDDLNTIRTANIWDEAIKQSNEGMEYYAKYNEIRNSKFLRVIVVPHSHCDPGWLKTFQQYFSDQTNQTLYNAIEQLELLKNMTFIWAETSFLKQWAENAGPKMIYRMKNLLKSGRLEIVEGGWVVPDQATPSIFGLFNQMVEGHWWLKKNLNFTPVNGWALDPFGYSDTHPYLYKLAGYDHMVILRVHSGVKHKLEENNALHFNWRQPWDSSGRFDMQTHMMPYMLYNIKHTCGPNTDICLQFDFRKIPGEISEATADEINNNNIERLSKLLIGQWRKKAEIASENKNNPVILVPLGDDFRYDRKIEWNQQYNNYMKLFNYMNSNKELNIDARFGTISDFVKLKNKFKSNKPTVNLMGDFFPYADVALNYWTGFFTTRPALKRLGKVLEYQLRATEFLFSFTKELSAKMTSYLSEIRQEFGLFMHHDAITGTANWYVVMDYKKRMNHSLKLLSKVTSSVLENLLERKVTPLPDMSIFNYNSVETLSRYYSLIIFNSIEHKRDAMIDIAVSEFGYLTGNGVIDCQINPLWEKYNMPINVAINKNKYILSCLVSLNSLSIQLFKFVKAEKEDVIATVETSSEIFGVKDLFFPLLKITNMSFNHDYAIKTPMLETTFSRKTGFLTSLQNEKLETDILAYESTGGAYLFSASSDTANRNRLSSKPIVHIVNGKIFVDVIHVGEIIVHSTRIIKYNSSLATALHFTNYVNLSDSGNIELIMRFKTAIQPPENERFFTDLNGFNMRRRKNFDNIPLQANFYPATEYVITQDLKNRLTILLSQSHAVSSLKPGQIDVLIDRSPTFDDGKGLGMGINQLTPSKTYISIVLENRFSHYKPEFILQPSLIARHLSFSLNNPVLTFFSTERRNDKMIVRFINQQLPCDIRLIACRKYDDSNLLVVLQRLPSDCPMKYLDYLDCRKNEVPINLYNLFSKLNVKLIEKTSLTMMTRGKIIGKNDHLILNANEIHSFRLQI